MDVVKRTGVLKRYADWKGSLDTFLQVGDAVDEAFQSYFLEVLFPAHFDSSLIQMGEPYDHDAEGKPRFDSIQRYNDTVWIYTGHRCRRDRVRFT